MRRPGSINARMVELVEYGPDPRGWRIFTGVTAAAGQAISGARRVLDPVATFSGRAIAPQGFTGAARLGTARPVVKAESTLADERSAGVLTDTATRLFADRLTRRAG